MDPTTDPARELAEIAGKLSIGSSHAGDKFLAEQFGVEPWSTEFVKILACILERADQIAVIVSKSQMDDDHRDSALDDLTKFKRGFTGKSLQNPWNNSGNGLMTMKDHGRPLQYLSTVVRPFVSYPKLSEAEISEFLELIEDYLAEITESDASPEFVRQAITDGLTNFKFQLQHIGWMGSGYAITAFREVMFVYETSKRQLDGSLDDKLLKDGLFGILKKFKDKVDAAQGWGDTTQTIFKGYNLVSGAALPILIGTGNT